MSSEDQFSLVPKERVLEKPKELSSHLGQTGESCSELIDLGQVYACLFIYLF